MGTEEEDEEGTVIVPTGTTSVFTERLLRNILDLNPGQQVELCGYLAIADTLCVAAPAPRPWRGALPQSVPASDSSPRSARAKPPAAAAAMRLQVRLGASDLAGSSLPRLSRAGRLALLR